MDNILDQIWNYGFLQPEEQLALDRYVIQHPDYATLLEDAKAMYVLAREAQLVDAASPGDNALAYYIAHESIDIRAGKSVNKIPDEVVDAYQELGEKVKRDKQLHERYLMLKQRMALLADTSDPVSRFQALTGHAIEEVPATKRKRKSARKHFGVEHDRPPVVREKAPGKQVTRRIVYGVLGVFMVFISILYLNRYERLVYMDSTSPYKGAIPELRGHTSMLPVEEKEAMSMEELLKADFVTRFAGGLRYVFGAQHVRFGFYYYYDQARLKDAEVLFRSLLNEDGLSESHKDEVRYVLAKVLIAKNENAAAISFLDEVESAGRAWSEAASELKAAL